MIKVKGSSFVKEIGFENNILSIKLGREHYKYMNVPEKVFKMLKHSDSTGKAYCELVKGKFECYKKLPR